MATKRFLRIFQRTVPPKMIGEFELTDDRWFQVDEIKEETEAQTGTLIDIPPAKVEIVDKEVFTLKPTFFSIIDDLKLSADSIPPIVEWDFGSKDNFNKLEGFSVAHVFLFPGIYKVICKVNGKEFKTWNVNVKAAKETFIYVSTDGDDKNPGTDNKPVKTISQGIKLVNKDGSGILCLKNGQIHELWDKIEANFNIETYGGNSEGTEILWKGLRAEPQGWTLRIIDVKSGFIVKGITVRTEIPYVENADDAEYKKQHDQVPIPFNMNDNTALINCSAINCGWLVNLNNKPKNVLIQSCNTDKNLRNYLAWVEGENIVLIGNTGTNSKFEHLIRVSGDAKGVTIFNNVLTNEDNRNKDKRDDAKGAIVIQKSSYVYSSFNKTSNSPNGIGALGRGDGLKDPNARVRYVVARYNTEGILELWHGLENAYIYGCNYDRIRFEAKEAGYPEERKIRNVILEKCKNIEPLPNDMINVVVK